MCILSTQSALNSIEKDISHNLGWKYADCDADRLSFKPDSYNEPRSVFEDLTQVTLKAE